MPEHPKESYKDKNKINVKSFLIGETSIDSVVYLSFKIPKSVDDLKAIMM